MAVQNKVSLPVIKRLPKYYRYLTNLSADGKDKDFVQRAGLT